MIGLIQRVSSADVIADGEPSGAIGPGLLLLLGVEKGDTSADLEKLLNKRSIIVSSEMTKVT